MDEGTVGEVEEAIVTFLVAVEEGLLANDTPVPLPHTETLRIVAHLAVQDMIHMHHEADAHLERLDVAGPIVGLLMVNLLENRHHGAQAQTVTAEVPLIGTSVRGPGPGPGPPVQVADTGLALGADGEVVLLLGRGLLISARQLPNDDVTHHP